MLDHSTQHDEQPLMPRDIIVMVADIDRYAPHIQAVFGNAPSDRFLPYAISDRKAKEAHPIIQAFLTLLDLPQSRFNVDDILMLLDVPALAKCFDLTEDELRTLRRWVEESGIHWGLNDENIADFSLPVTGQNTWQFGLTRMLLGYVMESESGDWQGVLPYDESSGLIAALVGKLADFLMALTQWRQKLLSDYTLSEWQPICLPLLNDFFHLDDETEAILSLIEQQWQQMITYGATAQYSPAIPLVILRDEMNARLENERISQRFLAGSINFCTLMPMRSIPFKVVCLLGMNDGIYPRTIQPLGFDLMATQNRRGDRSRRDDDRYLFLEALLSAQQRLYISYIGYSIQDNSVRYPSVLVTELLDYIAQSHVLSGDEENDIDTSAVLVHTHLVHIHTRMPFNPQNFIVDQPQQSYASEWLPAAKREGEAQCDFSQALTPMIVTQIEIDELRRFYRHPVRAFFQQRLGVRFMLEEPDLNEEEPFSLNPLQRYQVNTQLLNAFIAEQDIDKLFQRLKTSGELPYGAFAELFWQEQYEAMSELAERVKVEKQSVESQEFSIEIDEVNLYGWINQAQDDGILRWRAAELTILDGMALWIDHLVYCYLGGTGESRMLGRKKSQWCFQAISREQAREELRRLVTGYLQGLQQPLLLTPKSCWSWLEQCYDSKALQIDFSEEKQAKARLKFIQIWQGDTGRVGEAEDNYYMRLFRVLSDSHLQDMIKHAEHYLLPLMQAKITK